ncbi:MAG: glycosyltransferase [Actinomycetota bacterium]
MRFDYRVAYLTPNKTALVGEIERAGVPVTCLAASSSRDLTWVWRFRRLVSDNTIDVVHVHSPVAAAGARVALRTLPPQGRPAVVTTEHNMWHTHVWPTRLADGSTWALDDAHIAVSAAVRSSLPARLRARTEVIHHGIDLARVAEQRAARSEVRRELGLEGSLVVATVANLRQTKGWPDLLVAARQVLDEVDDAVFLAVGQGPMEEEIRTLHRQLGLGDRFRLLGYRADAVRLMAGSDVFCLASHNEGLPVVLMEAMALGLPIIATEVGGVGELVSSPDHGRLVSPRRPDQLAAALVELLMDERLRSAASASVVRTAEALDATRSVSRIESIYESIARN